MEAALSPHAFKNVLVRLITYRSGYKTTSKALIKLFVRQTPQKYIVEQIKSKKMGTHKTDFNQSAS